MKKLDPSATGVYLITVTPFTDSGALDLSSTDRMVDFCLDAGVTGLTVLGRITDRHFNHMGPSIAPWNRLQSA